MNSKKGIIWLLAVATVGAAQTASAQTLSSTSLVGYEDNGTGGYIDSLVYNSATDNSDVHAEVDNLQLSGLDGSNNPQTMTFSGWADSRSDYGILHNSTYASVTNNFYNANNPNYDPTSGTGTPYSEDALGFSQFTDTLQFGGIASSGYTANYIFHIDGTVTGNMTENQGGVLAGTIAGNYFITAWFGDQTVDTDYATGQYAINGNYSQTINVQLDSQAYVDNYWYADGSNISGEADFSDTTTLLGVEVFNPQGQLVTNGITITSSSGAHYAVLPEPSPLIGLGVGVLGLLRLRRKKR